MLYTSMPVDAKIIHFAEIAQSDPVIWKKTQDIELETEKRLAQCDELGVRFEGSDEVFGLMSVESFPEIALTVLAKEGRGEYYVDLAGLII